MRNRPGIGLLAVVLWVLGGGWGGPSPANAAMTEGRLAACPRSPNCVSSQAETESQRVSPLHYDGALADARARLLAVLAGMERTRVLRADDAFIQVEFRSALFGFVDDVAFQFDPPGVIHVRSASRTGYYDFGANRKRVEDLRVRFHAASGASNAPAR